MYEKEIRDRLCEMHNSGMSYDEISQKTNISKTTVGHVITGGRSIKNPTISLLLKVFPRCKIFLDGVTPSQPSMTDQSVVIGDNTGIANGIVGGSNTVTVIGKGSSGIPDDLRRDIVNSTVLSPAEKVEMLKELMKKE